MKIVSAEFVIGVVKMDQLPEDNIPQVAFAGRSNVGKSSLLNALLNRKNLVKVSGTPGKTREINFFLINKLFHLVDLPGIGYAKISKAYRKAISKTINNYLEHSKQLNGIVYLVDMKTGGTQLDVDTFSELIKSGLPVLMVCTKMDKLNQKERKKQLDHITKKFNLEIPPICVSAFKKTNLDQVWGQLLSAITPG